MRTPYPLGTHCLCLVPVAVLLCCVHIFIGSEHDVFLYFTEARAARPWLTAPMAVFSHGILVLFYPVYAFFLIKGIRGRKMEDILFVLAYVAAQVLIAALLCRFIKIAVGRPRPMTGGPFAPFSLGWGYQSFPSGHTGEVLGSSLPLLRRFGPRFQGYARLAVSLGFGLIVAAVAFSRLYLGMHHPTDLWGGLVLGSVSGYVSWVLYGYLEQRWRRILPPRLKQWLKMA